MRRPQLLLRATSLVVGLGGTRKAHYDDVQVRSFGVPSVFHAIERGGDIGAQALVGLLTWMRDEMRRRRIERGSYLGGLFVKHDRPHGRFSGIVGDGIQAGHQSHSQGRLREGLRSRGGCARKDVVHQSGAKPLARFPLQAGCPPKAAGFFMRYRLAANLARDLHLSEQ